jgi:uncharacterized protein (TIGR03066 family)
MSIVRSTLTGCLAIAVIGCGGSATTPPPKAADSNKDKIVGTWETTKAPEGLPKDAVVTVEFTKDGKCTQSVKFGEKTMKGEGTYEVDGDKIKTVIKAPTGKEEKETLTIKTLTDKELVTTEEKGGKTETIEFKKK